MQKVLYVKAQVVVGTFDDDGNLTGEQPYPEIRHLYYPHGLALDQYVAEVARECKRQEQEKQG